MKTEKQKQYEADGWHEVEPMPKSPCDGCLMGSANYSIATVDGKDYTKSTSCRDDCRILKDFHEPEKEHLFGQNIRDAIKSIRG